MNFLNCGHGMKIYLEIYPARVHLTIPKWTVIAVT